MLSFAAKERARDHTRSIKKLNVVTANSQGEMQRQGEIGLGTREAGQGQLCLAGMSYSYEIRVTGEAGFEFWDNGTISPFPLYKYRIPSKVHSEPTRPVQFLTVRNGKYL